MEIYGDKEQFALVIGAASGQMCQVEVWAGSKSLSPFDSSAYIPSFCYSLYIASARLDVPTKLFEHEQLFVGLTVEEAFNKLSSAQSAELESA